MAFLSRAREFLADRQANVAMLFAFSIIPITVSIGAAVEFSRASNLEVALQAAVDNAALAAAAKTGARNSERRQEAFRVLKANTSEIDNIEGLTRKFHASRDGVYTVKATADMGTAFGGLLGVKDMKIHAEAQATYASQGTEIAFAFDITNSMGFGTSWSDATGIMRDVLETLKQASGKNDFFVTLVPFSDRVNVGSHRMRWLEVATPPGWNGCMIPREQPHSGYQWAMDDDPPRGSTRFLPSEDPYKDPSHTRHYCPPFEITGPTNNVNMIMDTMNRLSRGSTGRFDEGLVWAWRALSHRWSGQWSVPNYPARFTPMTAPSDTVDSRRKVAVLVSDGHTNIYRYEVGGDGSDPFGWNNGSPAGFEHVEHMCGRMKAQGIEVHVMHVNGNEYATPYFRDCASPGAYTKVGDRASLLEAMSTLQGNTTSVRLIK